VKKGLKFEDLPMAVELLLEKIENLEIELNTIKENFQPKVPVELMTRKETADFFGISLVTISNWVKYGILISYRIGNRIYFKRSEIVSAMIPSRRNE